MVGESGFGGHLPTRVWTGVDQPSRFRILLFSTWLFLKYLEFPTSFLILPIPDRPNPHFCIDGTKWRRCARELNRHLCVPISFSGDNILKCSRCSHNIQQIGPHREASCKGPWWQSWRLNLWRMWEWLRSVAGCSFSTKGWQTCMYVDLFGNLANRITPSPLYSSMKRFPANLQTSVKRSSPACWHIMLIGLKEWIPLVEWVFSFWSAHFQGFCDRPPTTESYFLWSFAL